MANEARKIQQAQIKLQKSLQAFISVMATDAKKHFVASFRNQGFTDETLTRWPSRKNEISGGIASVRKRSAGSRAILVKTGDLRRSVRVINRTINKVVLGSDLPYAQIHNDGLYGRAWGKHRFKMPKRQFIGHSRKLIDHLKKDLDKKVFASFR